MSIAAPPAHAHERGADPRGAVEREPESPELQRVVAEARAGGVLRSLADQRVAARGVGVKRDRVLDDEVGADGERPLVAEREERALRLDRQAVALVDRGDAGRVERAHAGAHRLHALGIAHREHRGKERALDALREVEVAEDARRLSGGVPLDLDAVRCRRVASDLRRTERCRVGDGDARRDEDRRRDDHRVLRRGAIEVVARRPPALAQHADVVDRLRVVERRARELEAGAVHVGMAVDEPRHDGVTGEVHLSRRGAGQRAHLSRAADGDDPAALDRDRFVDGVRRVHRVDGSVMQHEVGRCIPGGRHRP